jgi:hypothetical protein
VTATPAPAQSRMRRALTFLAVVWSIGATFLALDAGMVELTSLFSSKSLPANLVLPRQSQAAFLHCGQIVKGLRPPAQDASVVQQSRYLAWRLGYMLGSADASLTSGIASRAPVEDALRQSLPATDALGIPSLELPQHGRAAYALREFTGSLEEDTQCVAASLEVRYSPRHAALYKFGAAFGFASVYRRLMPQLDDILAPQLRIYGTAAGVPANLYTALGQPFSNAPGTDVGQIVQSMVSRMDEYLKSNN